jgi:diguanylate cyclase (GGDEF)-like protein/putative nucleotidyltransferase with HDIG domain
MLPVPQAQGERLAPSLLTLPAVDPSPRVAARVGAAIFGGEALVLLAVALLPGGEFSALRLVVPVISAAVALVLYMRADRSGPRMLHSAIALGTLLVSAHAWGSDTGASLSGEMLYVWPALYVAYFFPVRGAAVQFAWLATAYLAVLAASVEPEAIAGSWLTVMGVLFPAAVLLRSVRDGVLQLVRGLSDAALTDPLTGLMNRLAFDRELEAEVARAERSEERFSVVIGDLDHFKSVNDRLGHRAGDQALLRVGHILERHRRSMDSIARTGGEEFTILLPGATEHEAYLVSERLLAAVEETFKEDPAGLTFSFGVATFPDHGRSRDAVLEAADQALYAAKALGRNRAVIFNAEISAIFAPEGGRGADEVQLATLLSLAEALDLRDTGTADHSRTVGRYCGLIAAELGLPPERVKRVEVAGILHDIGKMGLPDAILQKAGPLGSSELAKIRTHPEIGAQILSGRGLEDLRTWIVAHHERPDGNGYPRGLPDGKIPIEAKILAVADSYEAMTADRVYRAALDEPVARGELLRCAGTQFDARVVAAFLSALSKLEAAGVSSPLEAA